MPPPATGPAGFAPEGIGRRLLFAALAAAHRGLTLASVAVAHLAAGVLTQADLRKAGRLQYRDFGREAADVDAGLTPIGARIYAEWVRPGARVLIVGCGAGRDLVALRRLGVFADGLELVPEQAERARRHLAERGMTAEVHAGRIEDASLAAHYDAVSFAPACFSNIQGRENRRRALDRARASLRAGGLVILFPIVIPRRRAGRAWAARIGRLLGGPGGGWRPEPGDTFTFVWSEGPFPHFVHEFLIPELEAECRAAGFAIQARAAMEDKVGLVLQPSSSP